MAEEKGQCPAHRAGLKVTVTERHDRALRCTKGDCNLQAGHGGDCD